MEKIEKEIPFSQCPICDKRFPQIEIEKHVNKCIFLNSIPECNNVELQIPKRKRSKSPILCSKPNVELPSPNKKQKTNASTSKSPTSTFSFRKKASLKAVTSDEASKSQEKPRLDHTFTIPLAKQLQPKSLAEYMGQSHILGENTILRSLLEKCEIPNMVLWGPPGSGKTSLSGAIHGICRQNPTKLKFVSLCAATSGVKEVQNIIQTAKLQQKFGIKTVLFMDEIHRFNKKQQDIFLLHVERGDIILIGATTENPSFILNSALLSRCRVIVLEKLESEFLYKILENATTQFGIEIKEANGAEDVGKKGIRIERAALEWLADISDGDARIALGNLQLILQYLDDCGEIITIDHIQDKIKKSHMLYDRKGEEHYNIISAMHKSIRGSDANAALYWTTRMLLSGEDPRFIARRLVRAASEDIGNADPGALPLAIATMQGCQLIGMPEADVLLAQCAIYLARAPKSREADTALAKAKKVINASDIQPSVPMHIRNAPTKLMQELGYGRANPDAGFMPPGMEHINFFV